MGSRYLTELANWCREAGLVVHEESGWQTRSRSSGGFDGNRPWCIMWHHTASESSPQNDVNYMCYGASDRPLANILLDRNGEVWIMAAGATNTNGKGQALGMSLGTVPKDSMNTHALGIEAANNGVGERWPQKQIDSYFKLNNKLTSKLGMTPGDLSTHQYYAPDRKIDPATADAVEGPWQPSDVTSSGTWSVGDIRHEAIARADVLPPPDPGPSPDPGPPPPIAKDGDMLVVALDNNGTAWVGNGVERVKLVDEDVFRRYILVWGGVGRFINTSGQPVNGWEDVARVDDFTLTSLGVLAPNSQ